MTVIVDSGFRRGSDFVKARALGADAAMSGRRRCTASPPRVPGARARWRSCAARWSVRRADRLCADGRVDARYVGRG